MKLRLWQQRLDLGWFIFAQSSVKMSIVSFLVLYSTVLVTAAVAAKLSKLHYLPETDMNVVST